MPDGKFGKFTFVSVPENHCCKRARPLVSLNVHWYLSVVFVTRCISKIPLEGLGARVTYVFSTRFCVELEPEIITSPLYSVAHSNVNK
jgi:hypothetical protein